MPGIWPAGRRVIVPDLLLGDFDSMDQPADFDRVRRVPVEKDDTDTMLAVKTGLEQGCGEFYLYGGTGGKRLDHTLANLQTLLYLRRRGARGYLYDNDFVWTAIENETLTVEQTVEWGLLSVFCSGGDRAAGIDEAGVQYPLSRRVPDGGVSPGRQQPHHRAQGPDHRPAGRPAGGVGTAAYRRCFRDKIAHAAQSPVAAAGKLLYNRAQRKGRPFRENADDRGTRAWARQSRRNKPWHILP